MNGTVLVAYATRYGSTHEVADAVAARLRGQGLAVEVKPLKELRSLEGCQALVLGAPFYMGSLLKEARAFLERQRTALEQMPVALFALGPTSANDDLDGALAQLDGTLQKMPWLRPVASAMFVGAYDPAKLRLADKLVAALPASPLHGLGPHDDRDWDAIDAWADGLAGALGAASGPTPGVAPRT